MKNLLLSVVVALLGPALSLADAGVLIPLDKQQPNPAILSLEEMEITVRIDNGDARVFVRQVFANHTGRIEEGNYIFALPSHATISDFATWDGPVRLPAVILERKRAEEIYNQLKQQSVDPGLLQMGERGSEEAKRTSVFSARIVPIPAFGTKRLEIEYHESIPVENLKSYFAIPLRPDVYSAQAAAHLRINFEFHSAHPIRNFAVPAKMVRSWNRLKGNSLAGRKVLYVHLPVTPGTSGTQVASRVSKKSPKHTVKAVTASTSGTVVQHKVKQGETLYSIANSYNTSVAALQRINRNTATLRPGMILVVRDAH